MFNSKEFMQIFKNFIWRNLKKNEIHYTVLFANLMIHQLNICNEIMNCSNNDLDFVHNIVFPWPSPISQVVSLLWPCPSQVFSWYFSLPFSCLFTRLTNNQSIICHSIQLSQPPPLSFSIVASAGAMFGFVLYMSFLILSHCVFP